MEYQLTRLTKSNLDALVPLYKTVFGNKVSHDFVRRKFDTAYLGCGPFGHLAYFRTEPIAFHGAVPFRMQFGGRIEVSAQYGDAMTHPKHTGQGLFTELGHRTDAALQEAGINFVWGFPNQNSEYGYVHKLNWLSEERMLGFKINTGALAAGKILHRVSDRWSKKLRASLSEHAYAGLSAGSLSEESGVVTTVRDRAFYHYKSFGQNFVVALEGVVFWLKWQAGLMVGDVLAPSKQDFFKGLEALVSLVRKQQVGQIVLQFSPQTKLAEWMLERADETFESWMIGYKPFQSDFPLQKLKLTFGDLDTF